MVEGEEGMAAGGWGVLFCTVPVLQRRKLVLSDDLPHGECARNGREKLIVVLLMERSAITITLNEFIVALLSLSCFSLCN